MRSKLLIPLFLAASCGDPLDVATVPDPCVEGTSLTWANFGKPTLATWCVSCHGATVSGSDRNGAPQGLNFESLEQVLPHLDRILATSATRDWTMPPAGGMSATDREQLREWIVCGAPGVDDAPVPSCDTLASTDVMSEDFCDHFNAYSGDLTPSQGLDCLCVVDGDLVVEEPAAFPNHLEVGGDLNIGADSELPSLMYVAGTVLVQGGATSVSLPSLETVEALRVSGNLALTVLDLPRLTSVTGSLEVSDNPALVELRNLNALAEVGGDLVVERNGSLNALDGFHVLSAVGGSLVIEDNDLVESFYGFQGLETVGANLRVSGNDRVQRLGAFQDLIQVGGRLDIDGNAALQSIDTFPWLEEVGAGMAMDEGSLTIARNPLLELITPLSFASLHRTRGLIVQQNPSLRTLSGLHAVEEVTGDFVLSDNEVLDLFCAFSDLAFIGGEFQLISAPSLPTCNAERILERVFTIMGSSTIDGTDDLGTCTRLQAVCG